LMDKLNKNKLVILPTQMQKLHDNKKLKD